MSAWVVLSDFTDLEDDGREYRTGDNYPRSGYVPDARRLEALSTDRNRQHRPLIEPAKGKSARRK